MKTELIEYHRLRQRIEWMLASEWEKERPEFERHQSRAAFHERAVAWLESLKTIEELQSGPIFSPMNAEQMKTEAVAAKNPLLSPNIPGPLDWKP